MTCGYNSKVITIIPAVLHFPGPLFSGPGIWSFILLRPYICRPMITLGPPPRQDKPARQIVNRRHHGLRGSASPVLTATGFVDGRWQFSTPCAQNPHPLTNHKDFDYVSGPYGFAKFGVNPSMGASGQMGEIQRIFLFILFS